MSGAMEGQKLEDLVKLVTERRVQAKSVVSLFVDIITVHLPMWRGRMHLLPSLRMQELSPRAGLKSESQLLKACFLLIKVSSQVVWRWYVWRI